MTVEEIIKDFESYNCKEVLVQGYFTYEFEHIAMYIDQLHEEKLDYSKGIVVKIDLGGIPGEGPDAFKSYCTIEGTIVAKCLGNYGLYRGCLLDADIVECEDDISFKPID